MTTVQVVGTPRSEDTTPKALQLLAASAAGRFERLMSADFLAIEAIKQRLAGCAPAHGCHRIPLSSPAALLPALSNHVAAHGMISRLDIVDHGGPGLMLLGPAPLFHIAKGDRERVHSVVDVDALAQLLVDTAQVRLLGCRTANRLVGRRLLYRLASDLGGHRLVFGTIDRILPRHFDAVTGEFATEHDVAFLFSSAAALDGKAPRSHNARVRHLAPLT